MISTEGRVDVTSVQKAIIQTILYFDIFNYPLTKNEVAENSSVALSLTDIQIYLNELTALGCLKLVNGHYMPHWADPENVERRLKGNKRAKEMMEEALYYSQRASRLPFIKGLCISGSLSKNYCDDKSDIDFFVITEANRVWLCRSLFLIFYKLLPKSKKKYYCLNYFVSEGDMQIADRNVFVAAEIAHLIPTYGYERYKEFLRINSWYKEWFLNKDEKDGKDCKETKKGVVASVVESVFGGRIGNWCDEVLRTRTKRGWIKRFKAGLSDREFEVMYRSDKNAAKRHEKGYQDKVLKALAQKFKDMEELFKQKLN